MNNRIKGTACIVMSSIFWGLFPTFSRVLFAGGFTILQTVSVRAFIAGIIYLMLGLFTKAFSGLKLKDIPFFVIYGLTAVLGTYLFYALAIKHLSAAMASILLYTAPAFVIIFSRILYGDRITGSKITALCLTFLGSFMVVRGYDFESLNINALGILFGLLSGISYSMLTVIGRKGLKKYSPRLNSYLPTIIVAAVMMTIQPPWNINPQNTLNAAYFVAVAVFGSVLPYILYIKGLDYGIDGGNASLMANIEPLVATLCGVVFFKDSLEILQIFGIAVTLCGAAAAALKQK